MIANLLIHFTGLNKQYMTYHHCQTKVKVLKCLAESLSFMGGRSSFKVTNVVYHIASECKNFRHAASERCRNWTGVTKFHFETKKYVELTRF